MQFIHQFIPIFSLISINVHASSNCTVTKVDIGYPATGISEKITIGDQVVIDFSQIQNQSSLFFQSGQNRIEYPLEGKLSPVSTVEFAYHHENEDDNDECGYISESQSTDLFEQVTNYDGASFVVLTKTNIKEDGCAVRSHSYVDRIEIRCNESASFSPQN